MKFGEILTKLREDNNLSRKDFAKILGIAYINLSKYETNERFPPQDILFKIADYFDVSIDYLLGRSKMLKIIPVQDLLLKISEDYKIDYIELMQLAGYIGEGESNFRIKRIFEEVMKLSNEDQKELMKYIGYIKFAKSIRSVIKKDKESEV